MGRKLKRVVNVKDLIALLDDGEVELEDVKLLMESPKAADLDDLMDAAKELAADLDDDDDDDDDEDDENPPDDDEGDDGDIEEDDNEDIDEEEIDEDEEDNPADRDDDDEHPD